MPGLSLYQQFVGEWGGCTACPLSETRNRIVLARGSIPADLVFVGEAPGQSEDVLGQPFVGPAGKIQDAITRRALDGLLLAGKPLRFAYTNLVCCIPLGEDGKKTAEPDPDHIEACRPRLEQFLRIAKPRMVVAVGKLAETYLEQGVKGSVELPDRRTPVVALVHPAAILRQSVVMRGLTAQRNIVTLRNAVLDLEQVTQGGG